MIKAKVIVTPKKSVLDPQGEAVRKAIHSHGMDSVHSTRIGKFVELEIDNNDLEAAKKELEEIAQDLLSNPVIEDYRIEIEGAGA